LSTIVKNSYWIQYLPNIVNILVLQNGKQQLPGQFADAQGWLAQMTERHPASPPLQMHNGLEEHHRTDACNKI
jgi:hypothetical protein